MTGVTMFEKEAEEYLKKDGTKAEQILSLMHGKIKVKIKQIPFILGAFQQTYQDGAEFGYNKAKEELEKEKQTLFESNCGVRSKLRTLRNDYEVLDTHNKVLIEENAKLEESIFIQGYRQSEKRITKLEAQIDKLIDFVLSKTDCCDVCPITDTCINSEGTCPYAGILAKGEKEVTREWLIQFISRR